MSAAEQQGQTAAAAATEEASSFETILDATAKAARARTDEDKQNFAPVLEEFIRLSVNAKFFVDKDAERTLKGWVKQIDVMLSTQLNEIVHHPDFQQLEGSWRGLNYLVMNSETGTQLKIRMLNVSKKDLLKDLEKASEFDQSMLFKAIYEDEYGTFGGEPYGALIGDYEFGKHPDDISLLERVSNVAAAAHAPFISAASPQLFNWDSFTDMRNVRDLAKIFDTPEYAKWRSFRESADSRYVGLTLPHTLMRLPYGKETRPIEAFDYEENVDGKVHEHYCWGNAAYAYGARLTEAFAKYGWLAAIRGPEGGGLVQGLPSHTFPSDDGEMMLKCPTEVAITDRRENEFSNLGFTALVHCKNTDYAAFFGGQSCQKPALFSTPEANANSQLSARLPYIFCTSRIAHFLKSMARDKIGKLMEREDLERWLNDWIRLYTCDPSTAGEEIKAKHPLREARIDVEEVPGKPGFYQARAFLRPHFQFEGMECGMSLVATLPQPKK